MTRFCIFTIVALATTTASLQTTLAQGPNAGGPFGPQQLAAAGVRNAVAAPQAPFGPLTPEQIKYRDDILNYWQQETAKIQRYRCKFRRWEYDPHFGPKDKEIARTYAEGVIKYADPDKGLFRVEFLGFYTPPAKPNEEAKYLADPAVPGEQWICDGKSVFIFDYRQKKLIQQQLPPDMQGKAIADGPIPFMFGANRQKILQRYWVRVITPPQVQGEYWLEAWPKEKGAGFQVVHIILDQVDFLPKAMTVFPPGYHPQNNPAKTWFVFEEREYNWAEIAKNINPFFREFFAPKTPSGWEKEIQPFHDGGAPAAAAPQNDPAPQPPARKRSFFDPLGVIFNGK